MSTKIAREALEDLLMIARHIEILAVDDIHEDNIDVVKQSIREWAKLATKKQRDAVVNIAVLVDAIEDGVDIRELREYKELKQVARTG